MIFFVSYASFRRLFPLSSVTKLRLRSFFEGKNPRGNSLSSTSDIILRQFLNPHTGDF